jgi:glycosyltransferase involved in cell wall biosynthesis
MDGFVVLSEAVGKDLLELKPDAKISFMSHPWYDHFGAKIDRTAACNKLGIPSEKKVLLFFGLVRDYKGLDVLISAFSELDDSFQLVIAGEVYSGKEKYLEQIERSGVKERISFLDRYIPDDEVVTLYSAADVCVLPYRTATQSGVTAASFHFEVPVIATNVGGLKESVGDKELGLIIDNADPKLLSTAVENYFSKGLADRFISNIRSEKQNNSWDHFASEMIRFSKML